MSSRIRLIPTLLVTLFVMLGSGFLLAYQVDTPHESLSEEAAPTGVVTTTAATTLGGWPVLRHDSGQSGHNPDVGSFRPPLTSLDTIELEEVAGASAAILNLVTGPQRIFAMSQHVIWGVKEDDPADQWQNDDCAPDSGGQCFNNYLAYNSDRLVVVRQNFIISPTLDFGYELAVLNAATGNEIWHRSLGTTAPEVALEGNTILLLTEESFAGKITRLALSGAEQFKENADINSAGPHQDGKAVINGGRFVYARGDRVLAYRTDNGALSWVYTPTVQADSYGYDLVATSDALIISQAERVIKLNIADGTFLWETDIKPASCDSELGPNGAATDETTIAVTAVCDREIVALNYATGVEQWRKELGQVAPAAAIAMGGDVLYAAATVTTTEVLTPSLFTIYALDPGDNGAELDRIDLNPLESSSVLAISDGLLLTASNIGTRLLQRFERTPADLAAELAPGAVPACGATVGGSVTFNFLVTNNGPGATDATRADLTLPDGTATLSTSMGSCTGGASPFCELGPLPASQSAHITATVDLDTAGSYAPGISLSGDVRDHDESNDVISTTLTVNPAAPAGLDLTLSDIEITQGVQNLANNILLVKGKATFVRLYGMTNGGAVGNVSATLHGERTLSGEDLGTLSPIASTSCLSLDDTPDRDQLSGSFVFELPNDWVQAGVRFTAEINPDGAIPEVNGSNNTLEITRPFIQLPRICLKTYPVRTTGKQSESSSETDNLSPHFESIYRDDGNILSRALTMLPVREIKVFPSSHKIEEWEPFAFGGWGPYEMEKEEDNREDVLDTLWWLNLFSDDPDECDADDSLTHYVGMVHEGTSNSVGSAGLGIRDGDELMLFLNTGPNGPQAFDDPHGGLTLAHEIGHNYDRGHVDCRNPKDPDKDYPYDPCNFAPINPRGYYGFEFRDPTSPVVITPTMAGDVMSYAGDVWPSDYTWDAILGELCGASDCLNPDLLDVQPDATVDPPPITGDVLLLRGHISPTVAIQQYYRLPVEQVPKADEMWAEQVASRPLTATYALKLISGTTVLHSEPFSPTESADQEASWPSFGLVVPWITGTTQIDLTADGMVAISLTVSPSPPTVTAVSPNGGESFTDTLPVSWTAGDPDGDDLFYTVLYSGDGGGSWQALATGVETTTLTVDASLLPGSAGQGLVKVIASDGLNIAFRQSAGGFTLPDRPPLVAIYFPDDGGEYPSGSSLTLRGAVYDPEDGHLPAEDMSWTLSGIGPVGDGDSIALPGLADGAYSLTLTASDSSAQVGETSISFTIGQVNVPSNVYLPAIIK